MRKFSFGAKYFGYTGFVTFAVSDFSFSVGL
jgi:hypothetical protein